MWILIFALPNLTIDAPVGDNTIALVPYNDSRIDEICEQSTYASALVNNFEDQFGRKKNPSFLIINESAPQQVKYVDVITGFRNIIALSTIIKGHEYDLTSLFSDYPLYSDYFDFYPITPSKMDDGFITRSPAVMGYDNEHEVFRGQTSPSLAGTGDHGAIPNELLFNKLFILWKRHFLLNKGSKWQQRALFRSLEMAYHASSMPFKNLATMYDYGANASLWVSAFEILSHPKNGKASLQTVINLIGNYSWIDNNKKLRRSYVIFKNKPRGNLAQKLYKELYNTRNDFLHGNQVTKRRLFPFRNQTNRPITMFAPILYKLALLSFINNLEKKRHDSISDHITKYTVERALIEALFKAKQI